ncbi:hypothetical protein HYDPIDRAFT_168298 [Hydnomerulius pinastri MD-312]|uniref:Uncharacterized protein n=1 Tax=Hydnomerulius pinastri MD-312 TaxID=994086 RepID=A0A0C9WEF0_9AGAM|nr:hypothetical protein HYDPIDRAFT_168298 [Hydnomerulius pinastri MD-312]
MARDGDPNLSSMQNPHASYIDHAYHLSINFLGVDLDPSKFELTKSLVTESLTGILGAAAPQLGQAENSANMKAGLSQLARSPNHEVPDNASAKKGGEDTCSSERGGLTPRGSWQHSQSSESKDDSDPQLSLTPTLAELADNSDMDAEDAQHWPGSWQGS